MIKIGLNATFLNNRASGAKQRFLNIYIPAIKKLNFIQFVIFEPKNFSLRKYFKKINNVIFVKTKISNEERYKKIYFNLFYWPSVLKKYKFDIFENFTLPFISNKYGITVSTIHDLRYLHNFSSLLDRIIFKFFFNFYINKNNFVITVSNYIKKELKSFFLSKKIFVIPNVILKKKIEVKKNFKKKFNIKNKFILTVGHLEKRKNYEILINAFRKINKNKIYNLIIIGNDNGAKKSLDKKIEKLNLKNEVFILSNVSDENLFSAYTQCSLLVFPSLYEGFGIPILEALKFKSKICLSNLNVFKEITQNNLNYFNPSSLNSIVKVINRTLKQPKPKNFKVFKLERFYQDNVVNKLSNFYKQSLNI